MRSLSIDFILALVIEAYKNYSRAELTSTPVDIIVKNEIAFGDFITGYLLP